MSYCRFSSDNFGCDVYVWHDVSGSYRIAVAGNRIIGEVPALPCLDETEPAAFAAAHRVQMAFVEAAPREPIGGAHDGALLSCTDARHGAEQLLALRADGYRVPQYAIDALLEEADSLQKALSAPDDQGEHEGALRQRIDPEATSGTSP